MRPVTGDRMSPELKTPPHRRLIATGSPGVYRRGDRFVAVTYERGRRIKSTHNTQREAYQARASRIARTTAPSRERFDAYAERWLAEYQGRTSRGLAPSTREGYARSIRAYAIPYFARRRIGDLTRRDIKAFIAHLAATPAHGPRQGATRLSPSTIRTIMTPLKAMLAEAYELDLLPVDAGRVRVVVGRPAPTPAPRTVSREQYAALIEHLRPDDRLLVMLLRWTGLRIAEALGLRWEDLCDPGGGPVLLVRRQWQDGRLVENTKTSAGTRAVAVVPSLARALSDTRAQARFAEPADPIFATTRGTHQDSHNVRRRLRPAARVAGVPWMTPHTLRHSLATELVDRGYDISAVARVLGHRSEHFTRRVYVHATAIPRFDDLDT